MPAQTNQSYCPPICRCQHFTTIHASDETGAVLYCEVEGCGCVKFDEIPFEKSELFKAWSDYVGFMNGTQNENRRA